MTLVEKIASELKLDAVYLSRIVARSSFYYKDFTIQKKNGGVRYVSQPSPELKTLQYWVLNNILLQLPVSHAAYAYKKGDSIKKHAQLHCKSKYTLHTDVENFFGSIHPSHLIPILETNSGIFDQLGLEFDAAVEELVKICFRKRALCIGAVTSPAISNIIMNAFDESMIEFCKDKWLIYSRYADDIYISSNEYIDKSVLTVVSAKLRLMQLKVNHSKTHFYSKKYKRKITGIIITTDSNISIGKARRDEIKKLIYEKLVHGTGDPDQIMGYLSFLKDVEPKTYNSLIIKYSPYCEEDILKALQVESL